MKPSSGICTMGRAMWKWRSPSHYIMADGGHYGMNAVYMMYLVRVVLSTLYSGTGVSGRTYFSAKVFCT